MTTAEIDAGEVDVREPTAAKIIRFLGRTPVYLLLTFLGLLWLVPTISAFFTSLLGPAVIGTTGWWEILSTPSLGTLENYREIFDNEAITSALVTTIWVSIGSTILPIGLAALAAYAFGLARVSRA